MEDKEAIRSKLKEIYYDLRNPGSFGGKEKLYIEAKKFYPNLRRNDVDEWLSEQIVYTLHKQARKNFKRNPVVAEHINENFQADLLDMQEYSKLNEGYRYLLTVIDVFSKRAWVERLKSKNMSNVADAMEKILKENKPTKLMTDEGTEFKNRYFSILMKKYDINHFFAKNKDVKCSVVERFNKTLKDHLTKYTTFKGTRRYTDIINDFLEGYHKAKHRSIGMAPQDVTEDNSKIVFKNLYGYESKREYLRNFVKAKLKIGDNVRKKYSLKALEKGYLPKWTDETFEVYKALKGKKRPYYMIKNSSGISESKRYYPEEIQKIKPLLYRIEKIIRTRRRNGVKEYLVKWTNYPESENSWIPSSNLTTLNGNKRNG